MALDRVWIAGYGAAPPGVAGAVPVWIAPNDGTVPSAIQSTILGYDDSLVAGASPVWIAGYGGPIAGASPICFAGYGPNAAPPAVTPSVWSAADAAANGMTLSNGGLTVTPSSATTWGTIRGSIGKTSGKLYVEFSNSAVTAPPINELFGAASSGFNPVDYLGHNTFSFGIWPSTAGFASAGFTINYGTSSSAQAVKDDVYALAIDFAAGSIWFARNNVWDSGATPVAKISPMVSFIPATVGALFPSISFNNTGGGSLGVWTLQSTAAALKYVPPSGFTAWDGGAAPAHSAEALAYLARTTGGNEGGNANNIATLIDGLVADGVWAKLDALYVLAQQNQSDALLNLIGTSYPLTSAGLERPGPRTATFTSYVGFTFHTGDYLNTGFDPSIAPSPHFIQNNASFGVWQVAISALAESQMGQNVALAINAIYSKFTDNNFIINVNNSAGAFLRVPSTITKGLVAGDRSDATSVYAYQNGVSPGASAMASTASGSGFFWVGWSPNSGGGTTQTLSAAFIGASLGSAGQLALYNRLRTYMTAVGVP